MATKQIPDSASRAAHIRLLEAHEVIDGEFQSLFRDHNITGTVFNAMRALIQGPVEGMRIRDVGCLLIKRVPDITRLMDRMQRDGYVTRVSNKADRRSILVRLTAKGKRKCESLYPGATKLHREQFGHMSERELKQLEKLLAKAMAR